jgi:hypothetical protein
MFEHYNKENVKIVKKDGVIIENVEIIYTPQDIFILDTLIQIEDGDTIERILPSKLKEKYLAIDVIFNHETDGIPAHYQIKIQKQNSTEKSTVSNPITNIYNFNDNTGKVNINSDDKSITNINTTNDTNVIFDSLVEIIKLQIENNSELLNLIEEMKTHMGKNTFKDKYIDFIGKAADHMNIIAPFVPALTTLLK